MRKLAILVAVLLFCSCSNSFGQIFWVENFEGGSSSGLLAGSYTGLVGTWATTSTGTNGADYNPWFVSCAENGHTTGVCGTGCVAVSPTATRSTLHIGTNSFWSGVDGGASYDAGGTFCALTCPETNQRAESPTINCTGKYGITLKFYYIENGDAAIDDATLWYYNGSTWTLLVNTPKTPGICPGGQGYWDHYTIALPSSADNNPNVKLGINWTNNDDGTGTDPSFAIDSMSLSTSSSPVPVPSFTLSNSSPCLDSCTTLTNTSTGSIDSFTWSIPSVTVPTPHTSPATVCFTTAGSYVVTLTVYRGGIPYTATHTVNVIPTPHPPITKTGHTLTIPTGYGSYQWLNTTTPIAGATTNSYTFTSAGMYVVVVDSAGCPGYSSYTYSPLGVSGLQAGENTFTLAPQGRNSLLLMAAQPLDVNLDVHMYDITGREVYSDTWFAGAGVKSVNVADLTNGLYIIRLSSRNTSAVLKWMKKD